MKHLLAYLYTLRTRLFLPVNFLCVLGLTLVLMSFLAVCLLESIPAHTHTHAQVTHSVTGYFSDSPDDHDPWD